VATIKLSQSVLSVIETDVVELEKDPSRHGLTPEEARAYRLVMKNLEGDHLTVPADPDEIEAMSDVFGDLSNTFDDYAEYGGPGEKKFNRAAAKSLSSVAMKLAFAITPARAKYQKEMF
jgi:hypothetical protein